MGKIERVIFVHGTGATALDDVGQAWWQRDGYLWKEFICLGYLPEAFIWSGQNSERARRAAGITLRARIEQINKLGEQVHLIGHSHGGSVIKHALEYLPLVTAACIVSWSTVGTPVMRVGIRRGKMHIAIIVFMICLVAAIYGLTLLNGVHLWYARRDSIGDTVKFLMWLTVPLVGVCWTGMSLGCGLFGFLRSKQAEIQVNPQKYLSLWSKQDEPIVGLGASGSFSLRVLSDSSAVNHVAGKPLNQFVNNIVSRSLQGIDISYLELIRCESSAGSLGHRPLPDYVDELLIQRANEHAAVLGAHVREIIVAGADPMTGFVDLLHSATRTFTFRELVHTSYFDDFSCRALLLYHAIHHSSPARAAPLNLALRDWYADRFVGFPEIHPQTLPANRLGYVAVAVAIGATMIALSISTSLEATWSSALAPTTAQFHLREIMSGRALNAALSSVAGVDQLETVIRDPQVLRNDSGSVGGSLDVLHSYLAAALSTDGNGLIKAAKQVDSTLLPIFYDYALPFVHLNGSRQQLYDFANSSFYPGPVAELRDKKGFFPALEQLVWIAGVRNILDRPTLNVALSRCSQQSICTSRVHLAAVRALSRVKSPLLEQLVPLPSANDFSKLSDDDFNFRTALVGIMQLRSPLNDSLTSDDRELVIWLVKHREWMHISYINPANVGALPWSELESEVRRAIDGGGADQLRVAMFLQQTVWEPKIPSDISDKASRIAMAETSNSVPLINPAELLQSRRLVDCEFLRERNRNSLFKMLRKMKNGQSCKQFDVSPDPDAAIQEISSTKSINEYLLRFNDLGIGYWPEVLRSKMQADLIATLLVATCHARPEEQSIEGPLDRQQLRLALRMLHASASIRDVIPWFKPFFQRRCGERKIGSNPTSDQLNGDLIAFELIDWLGPEDSGNAELLMKGLSRTRYGPVANLGIPLIGTGVPTVDYVRWFDRHGYHTDVLFITASNPAEFRLARQTAAFKLASCRCASCDEERLMHFASKEGALARAYATPVAAMSALKAEAQFYAIKQDWRRAMSVCTNCSPAEWLAVATTLIKPLYRETNRLPIEPLKCQAVKKEQFDLIFNTDAK
ncbi:hypothetical protein AKG95_14135 [Janthinobacterium lividum]|uniref:Alpha/beta hydrolase n=1 Tax=Janthinobacterium lividum TaxID=29581 RepID=A0A1S1U6C8_9BURK|nr:hypothetical protein [Janthinobacterium lividum]OHV96000.1 hypothetical protein AKG95_14135 [Janthinobacterium lividum]